MITGTAPLASRRILVVEDQYYLAADICEWLEAAGADVLGPAADAVHACDLIRSGQLNWAVVDVNLGTGPTFEVAGALHARGIPFLFATGYDQEAIPPVFKSAPRLEKPFSAAKLVDAVSALE